jgi:hypothetical protein
MEFKQLMNHLFEKHRRFQSSIAAIEHPIQCAKLAVAAHSHARLLRRPRPHKRVDSTNDGSE